MDAKEGLAVHGMDSPRERAQKGGRERLLSEEEMSAGDAAMKRSWRGGYRPCGRSGLGNQWNQRVTAQKAPLST